MPPWAHPAQSALWRLVREVSRWKRGQSYYTVDLEDADTSGSNQPNSKRDERNDRNPSHAILWLPPTNVRRPGTAISGPGQSD